jgi:hypothetical protein
MTDVRVAALVLAVLVVVLIVLRPKHAWRWHSGHTLDGRFLTNATWTRPATKVLHPTGNAMRWHKWPRLLRAAIRTGFTVCLECSLIGIALAPWPSFIILGCLLAAGTAWTGRKGYRGVRRLWPS